MLTLNATVSSERAKRPEGMSWVSFWDESQTCGVSFSCYANNPAEELEVMVSDQSCYYPDTFSVQLSRRLMRVSFAPGTIDATDGGDEYAVQFEVSDDEYRDLKGLLRYLLEGRAIFRCTDDGA
jgi:hypothetical protein